MQTELLDYEEPKKETTRASPETKTMLESMQEFMERKKNAGRLD